MPQKYLFTFVQ